jgi:Ca-activated chloride channel homolog
MEVNGRVIEGLVDERGAARQQYEQAIVAGHRAAIGEEERAGVFTLRVGNLMPGERATVTLSLVGPLPVDDGEVTFQFPLVVAPRYIPGTALGGEQAGVGIADDTDLVPDASRISPPVRLPGMPNPVQLAIEVAFDASPRDITSSLHAIDTGERIVRVQPGERLDRDFILRWRADSANLTSSLVCADNTTGGGGTFMLTLVPPSTRTAAQKPRDVVFVLDRSGSMGGWKMVAARRAAARMIDTLTSRDRFCVLAFDNRVEAIPEARLVEATDRVRFRAVEQIAAIDSRGGTELHAPLAQAIEMLAGGYDDRERVVVLVTDGQVGNEDHILRELAPKLRNVRMFTLGIDHAVNAAFLRRLAAVGAGLCELVESEDRLDAVMAKVHHRIGAPIASELALHATGLEIDRASLAPARVPDVYAGAPVVVFGRYTGTASSASAIELEGSSFGERYHVTVPRAREAIASGWLGASWARARIRDLEDRYAAGESRHESEIVSISKQFTVLSRFTAFVAVDHSEVVNRGGHVKSIVQPVEEVRGWSDANQPQTRSRSSGKAMHASTPMPFPQQIPMPMKPPGAPAPITATAFDMAKAPTGMRQYREPQGPMSVGGASPPPPPASMPPREMSTVVKPEPISPAPYLATLAELAAELARATEVMALRMLRQRLTEWIEDVRSVGGLDTLAAAVDHQLRQLLAVLDVATARAVAKELETIVKGGGDPPKRSRLAFWK